MDLIQRNGNQRTDDELEINLTQETGNRHSKEIEINLIQETENQRFKMR